ncbi:uncharacterized protein [Typha latifolia]|uniref:uncharacterized protein n=1 Tax=Typha latifolia TaxID=4733 RepID=UPI003C2C9F04
MEGKRPGKASSSSSSSSSSSLVDVIFGKKEEVGSHDGYFSGVFPPPSAVMRKDSQNSSKAGNARSGTADRNTQESPSKCQSTQLTKDGKPIYSAEPTESPYFGSSVHYGCRDFYPGSPSKNTPETTNTYKNSEEDSSDSSNYATRGNWWQGSLYY